MSDTQNSAQDSAKAATAETPLNKARDKKLKEKSARLHDLCHEMAKGLPAREDIAARWEGYWICNALAWDQMQSGVDWLGAAEGKLWRYKSDAPWKSLQELLAFSGSAPMLGVKPDDPDAILADDAERARIMVTWAVPIVLGDPGADQSAFSSLDQEAAQTVARIFAQAMELGDDAELACVPQLLDPRKLRLLERDRGGLRAFWSTMAQPKIAPEAATALMDALTFANPHEERWPALAWIVFGFWPKNAAASQKIFTALAPRLGPGCARGLDEAQEAASAILRAALKANQDLKSTAASEVDNSSAAAELFASEKTSGSRLELLDAQAEGLPEFALYPPMPMGFALQTHDAITMMLPAAALLAARGMKKIGVESVGWVVADTLAEKDEDAWKKGAVWALGRDGATTLWNPTVWLSDMQGPEEITQQWRERIEAAFAGEGLKWRAPVRLKASHAQSIIGQGAGGAAVQSPDANPASPSQSSSGTDAKESRPMSQPLSPKAVKEAALGDLGLLDPRAMGASSGTVLTKKPR